MKEQTIPKEDYLKLQNELNRKNDKIKRLEEINTFFNELQEEQDAYETMDVTPPFRLEKNKVDNSAYFFTFFKFAFLDCSIYMYRYY